MLKKNEKSLCFIFWLPAAIGDTMVEFQTLWHEECFDSATTRKNTAASVVRQWQRWTMFTNADVAYGQHTPLLHQLRKLVMLAVVSCVVRVDLFRRTHLGREGYHMFHRQGTQSLDTTPLVWLGKCQTPCQRCSQTMHWPSAMVSNLHHSQHYFKI